MPHGWRTAFVMRIAVVVLVRVAFSADGRDALQLEVDSAMKRGPLPPDWSELAPEIGPREGDLVITKRHWGAFTGTELDLQLRRRGVTTIVLGGIATNFGVESTARSANEFGYSQIFAEDAMTSLSGRRINSPYSTFSRALAGSARPRKFWLPARPGNQVSERRAPAIMSTSGATAPRRRIAIVGGGFSGVMTAVNLARLTRHPLDLTIINQHRPTARGIAYGTRRMEHLLNVAARNMSAFPDHPDHFLQWLRTRSEYDTVPDIELRERFIPRMLYGITCGASCSSTCNRPWTPPWCGQLSSKARRSMRSRTTAVRRFSCPMAVGWKQRAWCSRRATRRHPACREAPGCAIIPPGSAIPGNPGKIAFHPPAAPLWCLAPV